jgi:hypothetical protein
MIATLWTYKGDRAGGCNFGAGWNGQLFFVQIDQPEAIYERDPDGMAVHPDRGHYDGLHQAGVIS